MGSFSWTFRRNQFSLVFLPLCSFVFFFFCNVQNVLICLLRYPDSSSPLTFTWTSFSTLLVFSILLILIWRPVDCSFCGTLSWKGALAGQFQFFGARLFQLFSDLLKPCIHLLLLEAEPLPLSVVTNWLVDISTYFEFLLLSGL